MIPGENELDKITFPAEQNSCFKTFTDFPIIALEAL